MNGGADRGERKRKTGIINSMRFEQKNKQNKGKLKDADGRDHSVNN